MYRYPIVEKKIRGAHRPARKKKARACGDNVSHCIPIRMTSNAQRALEKRDLSYHGSFGSGKVRLARTTLPFDTESRQPVPGSTAARSIKSCEVPQGHAPSRRSGGARAACR